jgi:hypothetical protein
MFRYGGGGVACFGASVWRAFRATLWVTDELETTRVGRTVKESHRARKVTKLWTGSKGGSFEGSPEHGPTERI